MTIIMETLCAELHIDPEHGDERQLHVLQQWCHEHISQDINYQGTAQEKYTWYMALATHYNDYFLAKLPENPEQIDENILAFKNMNAVQYAADHGYDRYIMGLTRLPNDVLNKPNSAGMTPLHLAAVNGHVHTLRALIAQGANPNKTNKQSQLPIHSALIIAARYTSTLIENKEAIFRELDTLTPDLMARKDNSGDTVLHLMACAAMGSHVFSALCAELLSRDAHPQQYANHQTHYPIHTAILNNKIAIIESLLKVDGVARLTDAEGKVALHYAAQYDAPQTVLEQCIAATPDINCRDRSRRTPLMVAAEAKNISAMDALIKHGADATMTDDRGYSILQYAMNNHDDILTTWILENTSLSKHNLPGFGQENQAQI